MANAIFLGVWETAAVTTKRVPTISGFCTETRKRHKRETEALILLWLAGLGVHLLRREH
ncbi:MAG TPA: hypothetical protein VKE92_11605 [Anaerolineales bacterium]|nr:hypothetical protein [Anaerolineales bacterium]